MEKRMACPRGAASPDSNTQKRLFADSGGHCQNPSCECELFVDASGKVIHIAEMAHVFAASDRGPRANPGLTDTERGSFDNLVVLCANCHTMVDKAPESYPDEMMKAWKRGHAEKFLRIFGVLNYKSRAAARAAIEPILAQNRAIFDQYGPHAEAAFDPESGAAQRWRRKMVTHILPNNNRVLALLDANMNLLFGDEQKTLELFRQHIDDLKAYHIEGIQEDASRFPTILSSILENR
jgi:hypothetical protein